VQIHHLFFESSGLLGSTRVGVWEKKKRTGLIYVLRCEFAYRTSEYYQEKRAEQVSKKAASSERRAIQRSWYLVAMLGKGHQFGQNEKVFQRSGPDGAARPSAGRRNKSNERLGKSYPRRRAMVFDPHNR